jgi:hypothetical protein
MGRSGQRKRSLPNANDDEETTTTAAGHSGEKAKKKELKAQGNEKKKIKESIVASKENAKENNGDQEDDDGSKKEDDDSKDHWKLTMDELEDINYETAMIMRADADRQHRAYTICESHKDDLAECKEEKTLFTASVLLEKKLVGRALVRLIATSANAIQEREQLLKERNHFERKYIDLDRMMKVIQSDTDAKDILVAAENAIFKDGIHGDLVFHFPFPSLKVSTNCDNLLKCLVILSFRSPLSPMSRLETHSMRKNWSPTALGGIHLLPIGSWIRSSSLHWKMAPFEIAVGHM